MAYQIEFHCENDYEKTLKVNKFKNRINIVFEGVDEFSEVYLDKPTAIKFAKTLRTEINKIKEVEDGNR